MHLIWQWGVFLGVMGLDHYRPDVMQIGVIIMLAVSLSLPSGAAVLWRIGSDDGDQDGLGDTNFNDSAEFNGAGFNVSGVQENGNRNVLPGSAFNTGGTNNNRDTDDDYYFAGSYFTVVDGGNYNPVGTIFPSESYYERAITNPDRNMRWHFNAPESIAESDTFTFSIDFYQVNQQSATSTRSGYELSLFVDGVQIGDMQTLNKKTGQDPEGWQFTLDDLGGPAQQGPGFDQPPFSPIRSGPKVASKPSRKKQIPSSSTRRALGQPRSDIGRENSSQKTKQVPFPGDTGLAWQNSPYEAPVGDANPERDQDCAKPAL